MLNAARGCVLLGLLSLSPTLHAVGPVPDLPKDRELEFGLRFSEVRNDLPLSGATRILRTQEIGFGYRERFGSSLTLGLRGGVTFATVANDPAFAGQELSGYHAVITVGSTLWRTQRFRLYGEASMGYQDVEDAADNTSNESTLEWRAPRVEVGGMFTLATQVRLFAGARYGVLDGEHRITGTTNTTQTFDERASGAFVGLDLTDERDGSVGISWSDGLDRGVELYFRRLFRRLF